MWGLILTGHREGEEERGGEISHAEIPRPLKTAQTLRFERTSSWRREEVGPRRGGEYMGVGPGRNGHLLPRYRTRYKSGLQKTMRTTKKTASLKLFVDLRGDETAPGVPRHAAGGCRGPGSRGPGRPAGGLVTACRGCQIVASHPLPLV